MVTNDRCIDERNYLIIFVGLNFLPLFNGYTFALNLVYLKTWYQFISLPEKPWSIQTTFVLTVKVEWRYHPLIDNSDVSK